LRFWQFLFMHSFNSKEANNQIRMSFRIKAFFKPQEERREDEIFFLYDPCEQKHIDVLFFL